MIDETQTMSIRIRIKNETKKIRKKTSSITINERRNLARIRKRILRVAQTKMNLETKRRKARNI